MLSLSSIRKQLPVLPTIHTLPLGIPPWVLLLIPLLGGVVSAYALFRAAGPSWWPGVESLDEAGTCIEDEELKEEQQMGRKRWQHGKVDYREYDVILCGGGTTGCVLAARLSENPKIKVLLLEAGKAGVLQLFSRIPSTFARLFQHETASWGYRFAPHPATKGRELLCPRARMLGGCSSINAMMCHHCAPSDFDEIAALGFDNFSSATLEPYFKKSQSHVESPAWPLRRAGKNAAPGDGPVQTGFSWINELCSAFVKACGRLGMEIRADVNDLSDGMGTMGVSRTKTFIHKGSRVSTATAYLTPDVIARSNLHVAVGATVTRVLFDSTIPPRAIGVEFTSLEKPYPSLTNLATGTKEQRILYRATARKDVILTAGVFGSAQILKVSGVGPRDELEQVGVKVVSDLPEVGTHLKDHLSVGMSFVAKKGVSLQHMAHPLKSLPFLVQWLKHKTGPLTTNVAESLCFVRSTDKEWTAKAGIEPSGVDDNTSGGVGPDIELINAPLVFARHGGLAPPMTAEEADFYSLAPLLLRPKSQGTVTIVSKDIFVKPVIDARFLTDPHDIKLLIWGLKLCRKVAATEPLASLLVKPFRPDHPDFPVFPDTEYFTEEELAEWVRGHAEVLYHPVGTVALGRCLDRDLKVNGTAGLRVLDASIFPEQLSGHPMAPLIAISEKFSDELKKEYKVSL